MPTPFFQTLIAREMQAVDAIIRRRLHSDVALIQQVAEYIILAGGKRMRPTLTLLSGQALGYSGSALHELAAMVECIHTATLLHDDVVDESDLRRGRETANRLFGNAASVLVGDFLYTRAFQMMVNVNCMPILEVMAEATNIIAEGEVLQLLNIGNIDISEDDYLTVIQYKTAKLFEAAAKIGALIAQAPDEKINAMATYGRYIGTAFQIVDDVLDYNGNEETIGKHLGDDLAEGKPTLPLIYAMHHAKPEVAEQVRFALTHSHGEGFQQVLAAVQSCNALDYALSQAKGMAQQAIDALSPIPDSESRQALVALAEQVIQREN